MPTPPLQCERVSRQEQVLIDGTGRWLENFAFRTAIEPLVFVLAALLVLHIAAVTVRFRAIRAAQRIQCALCRTGSSRRPA